MKIFKKIISLVLTAAVMMSMICVGTVNAGAFMTNDGKTVYIEETAPFDTSDVFIWAIEYVCPEMNFVILLLNNGTYWNSGFAAGKETNDLMAWLTYYDYGVSNSSITYPVSSSTAEITIKDAGIAKLLGTCTEIRQFYFLNSTGKWTYKTQRLTDYTLTTDSSSKKNISSLDISVGKKYGYTGKNVKASVTVKDGSKTLKKGTDYTLSYKNCKNTGEASVTIKGKGNYTGSKTLTYQIVPKKTTLKASKVSDSKVKFSWTAVKGAEKYQIYYSTDGKTYKRLVTVSGSKKSVTLKGLDFDKNDYRFKIRSYGTDDGKKYYSSFSKTVTIK